MCSSLGILVLCIIMRFCREDNGSVYPWPVAI